METTFEKLQKEADEIQSPLQISIEYSKAEDDIEQVVDRGNMLAGYIARSGVMLSEAKQLVAIAKRSELTKVMEGLINKKYSAKIQNTLLDAVADREIRLYTYIEQINKTCKYQIEWCRSLLSKAKAEMQYLNFNASKDKNGPF